MVLEQTEKKNETDNQTGYPQNQTNTLLDKDIPIFSDTMPQILSHTELNENFFSKTCGSGAKENPQILTIPKKKSSPRSQLCNNKSD